MEVQSWEHFCISNMDGAKTEKMKKNATVGTALDGC